MREAEKKSEAAVPVLSHFFPPGTVLITAGDGVFLPSTFHCKVWSQIWLQSSWAESCSLVGVKTGASQSLDSFYDYFVTFTCVLAATTSRRHFGWDAKDVQHTRVQHSWDWQNELKKKYDVQAVRQYPCECYSLSLCPPSDSTSRESYGLSTLESTAVLTQPSFCFSSKHTHKHITVWSLWRWQASSQESCHNRKVT